MKHQCRDATEVWWVCQQRYGQGPMSHNPPDSQEMFGVILACSTLKLWMLSAKNRTSLGRTKGLAWLRLCNVYLSLSFDTCHPHALPVGQQRHWWQPRPPRHLQPAPRSPGCASHHSCGYPGPCNRISDKRCQSCHLASFESFESYAYSTSSFMLSLCLDAWHLWKSRSDKSSQLAILLSHG